MRRAGILLVALALLASACSGSSSSPKTLLLGAVYPLTGTQGSAGIEEYQGVRLAAEMVNADGGVDGRRIRFRAIDVPSADAAPGAIAELHRDGIGIVLGSYGSTISMPAAYAAARRDMLFWETGAVGVMSPLGRGRLVFRVPPSGLELGGTAMNFVVHRLAPMLHRSPSSLRFAVAFANDAYGSEVARGAMRRIRSLHLRLVGRVPYDSLDYSAPRIVHSLAKTKPNVVFVSAYLGDGVAIRREIVREHLPLLANIGTSSSYCMPAFGARLGRLAVGVFASDKPGAEYINPAGLRPDARRVLHEAAAEYEDRYDEEMSAAALAGFSAAWALFHHVMPRASSLSPYAVAAVAKRIRLPAGSLPNGSGLEFGKAGTEQAGWDLRAASVIWEWIGVGKEAVVWPPRLATTGVRLLSS
jgi:branched-chain amino acid transport system substrate-binding protein